MIIPERVAHRAATRYVIDVNGCHVSTYSLGSHGYAQIGWHEPGRQLRATTVHRAAWVFVNGQIPEGMTVDHTCKNRRCVRIDHLRLLSNFDNARRTFGRDWPLGQCANGHPDSDLREWSNGKRFCRPCRRAKHQKPVAA